MTTNACAKRGFYPESRSARLWKAIAFAGGLVLGLASGPLHAAPSSGGDAVQGLYDVLLSTMDHADIVIAGFRLRRNQLEAEKSDEPAHD